MLLPVITHSPGTGFDRIARRVLSLRRAAGKLLARRRTFPDVAVATIVAKKYLSFARALAESCAAAHPRLRVVVLLADEIDGYFDPSGEAFELVGLDELAIPRLERFRFHYPQQPLSYASTPFLLSHLLRGGCSRVIFVKQESLILGDLTPVFDLLRTASIVLTPHLTAPLAGEDRAGRELNILLSGTYNVGLLGVASTPEADNFLTWWQDRVYADALYAPASGLHYEQRWLDLVPGMFGGVHVLRDPAYNVAHWNLPDRVVTLAGTRVLVNGEPCRLFRFSGYDVETPDRPTRYSTRLTAENIGPARLVFDRWRDALVRHGYHTTREWPYAYAAFDNGVPVPEIARSMLRELDDVAAARFGDPMRTGPGSYYEWLRQPAEGSPGGPGAVSRLWHAVHRGRPDLQNAFPDWAGADRDAFLAWTVQSGLREHDVPACFADSTAAVVQAG
jgi:hypothetical protein